MPITKHNIILAILGLFMLWFFANQSKFTKGGGDKHGKGGH